jgi:hypothetical protein
VRKRERDRRRRQRVNVSAVVVDAAAAAVKVWTVDVVVPMDAGCLVRVIRDFFTTTDGELSISAGEVLQIVEVVDKIWVRCVTGQSSQSREGTVPSANVTSVNVGMHEEGTRIFVAASEFNPEEKGDIHLAKGQ